MLKLLCRNLKRLLKFKIAWYMLLCARRTSQCLWRGNYNGAHLWLSASYNAEAEGPPLVSTITCYYCHQR